MSKVTSKAEEQQVAVAEVEGFRRDLGPFVVAAESTRMPMVFTDAQQSDNAIIFANDSFLSLTGYDRAEVLGQSFNSLMARSADPEALARLKIAFEGRAESDAELRFCRKDGGDFWAAVFISPVTDANGNIVQYFASFADLTKQKQEQAQSSMLIDELNHRVKNTLSTVQSIVSQALRKNTSDPQALRESIEARLFALSRSHDLLTRENWTGAGLHDLVNAALEPFGLADGRSERFVVTGSNIRLPPNAALALGIAFHELATNAVKYGAFSNEAGSILIGWTIEPTPEGARLIIEWREKERASGQPAAPKRVRVTRD